MNISWIDVVAGIGAGLLFCLWLYIKDKELDDDDDYFNY